MTYNYPSSSDPTWPLLRKYVANQVIFFSSVYPAMTFQIPSSSDSETQLIRKMLRNQADFYAAGGGGGGGGTAVPFCGVKLQRHLANQVVPNSTTVQVIWDNVAWDTDGFWDSGNPTVATIPAGKSGKYMLSWNMSYAINATGRRVGYIVTNGSQNLFPAADGKIALPSPQPTYLGGGIPVILEEGDTVQIDTFQNSGGNLNIEAGVSLTTLSITRIDDSV